METRILKTGKEIQVHNGEVVNSIVDGEIITEKALINEIKYLKAVGRKATKIKKKDLDEKIFKKAHKFGRSNNIKFALKDIIEGDATIKKDLAKINFSPEVFPHFPSDEDKDFLSCCGRYPKYITLENGFGCYMLNAYSRGKKDRLKNGVYNITYPVFFIIYWDGKRLRGYVPVLGNMYNVQYNCAFGREPVIEALKETPCSFNKKANEEISRILWEQKQTFAALTTKKGVKNKAYHNENLMMIDIENNITIK